MTIKWLNPVFFNSIPSIFLCFGFCVDDSRLMLLPFSSFKSCEKLCLVNIFIRKATFSYHHTLQYRQDSVVFKGAELYLKDRWFRVFLLKTLRLTDHLYNRSGTDHESPALIPNVAISTWTEFLVMQFLNIYSI